MRLGRKFGISGVVLGMVLATMTQAAADPPAGATGPAAGDQATITLVTGDRVVVTDGRPTSVRPARGREGMTFTAHTAAGHSYVIPADAMRLVTTGQVDRRLFDLTTLLEFGYDDAHRASVPLIVTHPAGGPAFTTATSAATRELPSVNGVAVEADKAGATAMWDELTDGGATRTAAAGVSTVWLDGKRRARLDRSVPQIGAPAAWEAGYTGDGVTIAVLDTGVDQTHPDLAGQEIAEQNFAGTPDNQDHFGHGTHVASIAAGTGEQSGGKYRGVAADAALLDGKVLDDNGFGQESWIIGGMQWAAEQGADIVNMSLGGGDSPGVDPLEEAVNTLSAQHGTLFVIAAGNSGRAETIGSPGSADAALTVGAVDRDDELAGFSSRGPRVGDGAIKPDVTAPGVEIVAALHADGTIGEPVEPGYTALSGTSMATPHVAGAAALLAQQHPDWTGAQLKAALSASAVPNPALSAFEQGAGRIDLTRAIEQTVVTEPANVSLGTVAWPHDDDEPVSKPLTYRNLSTSDVTLALEVTATGPDGEPAPEDMFSLSANEITVPAGGTAEVTVTGDTRPGSVDGAYSGAVVATAGESTTRTPVAVTREVESYTLTLDYLDRTGAPTGEYGTLVYGQSLDLVRFPHDADGSVDVRLPKGSYLLDHAVVTAESGVPHFSLLAQPHLELTEDTTVTVDAREAGPVSVTPPPAAAELLVGNVGFSVESERPFGSALITDDLDGVSITQLGPAPPAPSTLNGTVNTQWAGAGGSFYGLTWFPAGEVPTGFTKVVEESELATVRADIGAPAPDRVADRVLFAQPVSGGGLVVGAGQRLAIPGTRSEYLTTDGLRWTSSTYQVNGEDAESWLTSPPRSYRAGHDYTERYNYGMFGPALPDNGFAGGWAYRVGDDLVAEVPLFGDAAGNGGFSQLDSAALRLYRGDELIGETPADSGVFAVPPEEGDYRLTVETVRPDVFDVTTAVSAEWTFRSGTVPGNQPAPLDVSVLRFHPKLDATNSAPAGRPFAVPILLQHNGGAVSRARDLAVEVSYDDGATWQDADVLLNMVAVLDHPADATSVSLRASATDGAGNTVKQTIIRAYKLN